MASSSRTRRSICTRCSDARRRACSRSASARAKRCSNSPRRIPRSTASASKCIGPASDICCSAPKRATLRNVRMICHDAVEVLQHQLAPASIALVHIFFPDPWPKKRHHKRRLIQPSFVELLAKVIAPGGTLRLATDWEPYAQQMREVIDASPTFVNVAADAGFVARSADRALTRFERRGQRLGHGVWDLEYRRAN